MECCIEQRAPHGEVYVAYFDLNGTRMEFSLIADGDFENFKHEAEKEIKRASR